MVTVVRVRDVLTSAGAKLAAAGCETPRLDAELLLAQALRCDRAALVLRAREVVAPETAEKFDALLSRRLAREPMAYILARKAFRRITLFVDRRVLVPRPETELLVEAGLSLPHGAAVADVGTGSGAVALALKDERADLSVTGVELSTDALAVARENAARLGLEVEFVQGDLLDGLAGRFDAVLANLPYVASGYELAPEISQHEPAGALYAGPDGLRVIRRLLSALDAKVSVVALEVGFDQAEAVQGLVRGAGFHRTDCLHDLAGHERVVVARR